MSSRLRLLNTAAAKTAAGRATLAVGKEQQAPRPPVGMGVDFGATATYLAFEVWERVRCEYERIQVGCNSLFLLILLPRFAKTVHESWFYSMFLACVSSDFIFVRCVIKMRTQRCITTELFTLSTTQFLWVATLRRALRVEIKFRDDDR
jgi:hypothetical protein